MTPKEKAQELIDKMERPLLDDYFLDYNPYYKQCALIALDEILNYLTKSLDVQVSLNAVNYWQEVKQEIENL